MNEMELYTKIVDLYAGNELPIELENDLAEVSRQNRLLRDDMISLKETVETLRTCDPIQFTEESYQRILLKLYSRGVDMQKRSPDPIHLQYHLPILS